MFMTRKRKIVIFILFILSITLFISAAYFLYGRQSKPNAADTNTKEDQSQIGTITQGYQDEELPETSEEMDDASTTELSDIHIIGYDLIADLLTISALDQLYTDTRKYLDFHGYADVLNIEIIEDSIVSDRSYPYFECSMENTSTILEVRYDIVNREYEFNLLTR